MQCVPVPDVPVPTFATFWTVFSFWKHLAPCLSALIYLFLVCPRDVFDSGIGQWWVVMAAQHLVEGDSEDQQIYIKHSKLPIVREQPQFSDLKCKNLSLCGLSCTQGGNCPWCSAARNQNIPQSSSENRAAHALDICKIHVYWGRLDARCCGSVFNNENTLFSEDMDNPAFTSFSPSLSKRPTSARFQR